MEGLRAFTRGGNGRCQVAGKNAGSTSTDNLILESKISAPILPKWVVPRDRINKRLAGGSRCPLTVVTGPPGAGKSMALALWAESGAAPDAVAWVNLDDYD